MSGVQMAMLMVGGNPGALSGTMTTSAAPGTNMVGVATVIGNGASSIAGVLSASTFPSGATILQLVDLTALNKFQIAISDPAAQLLQGAFTQIVMNSLTFTTATATFFPNTPGGYGAIWQWSDSGVIVTGTGRTYAIT